MGKKNDLKEEVQKVIPKEEVNKNTNISSNTEKVVPKQPDVVTPKEMVDQNKELIKPIVISAEEEKLRQQQLQMNQQAVDTKKQEQQNLEIKRKQEQELMQQQEVQKQKLAQEKMFGNQKNINEQAPINNTINSNNQTTTNQLGKTLPSIQGIAPQNNPPLNAMNITNPPQDPNEKKTQKGGPSTVKRVLAILLFLSLMAMVYFLPEITNFMNDLKEKNKEEKITSGVLECDLKKSNQSFDIDIKALFHFTNNELYKMEYTTIHTGDKVEDKEELDRLHEECLLLKQEAGQLNGVTISCSLSNGIHSNKQILDYEKLQVKEVTSAYTEAGGVYPAEFKKSENIDKIESQMIGNNYTCKRK